VQGFSLIYLKYFAFYDDKIDENNSLKPLTTGKNSINKAKKQ